MKFLFKAFLCSFFLTISLSLHLNHVTTSKLSLSASRIGKGGECDKAQETKICDKGLSCTPVASKRALGVVIDLQCMPDDLNLPEGHACIYKFFGSQCLRNDQVHLTCLNTKEIYQKWHKETYKVGVCQTEGQNLKLPQAPVKDESTKKNRNALNDGGTAADLKDEEMHEVIEAYEALERNHLTGQDAFTIGYIILQYFVDEDEIKDKTLIEKVLKPVLEDLRSKKKTCEEVENALGTKGIHVVNTWTTKDRTDYLWMVNNKYLKGIKDINEKASIIKNVADGVSKEAKYIMKPELSSAGEIAGGFVKAMVDLAIQTVVNNELTNAMLASAASVKPKSGDGTSNYKAIKMFKYNDGSVDIGEGFGMISRDSICKELKVNAGLKYLKDVKKEKKN